MSLISFLSWWEGLSGMKLQGTGRSTKEILKRIDYGGSLTLLGAVSLKRWSSSMGEIIDLLILTFRLVPCSFSWACVIAKAIRYIFFFGWKIKRKYSSHQIVQWSNPSVWISFTASIAFTVLFLLVEIYVAVEPVLPPYLLRQKVPVLVGCSNALVAVCNLSVTYYFPTWFQTVMLTSASTAGKINNITIVEFFNGGFWPFFVW